MDIRLVKPDLLSLLRKMRTGNDDATEKTRHKNENKVKHLHSTCVKPFLPFDSLVPAALKVRLKI